MPQVRIGIEGNRKPILDALRIRDTPILVSANSLWTGTRFKDTWKNYAGMDVALDSGGFVSMKRYGGYRFGVSDYMQLAKDMQPTWWAQMDFCCEPEVAGNQAEVDARIERTAEHLNLCESAAREVGATQPMPVLQGWHPSDYVKGPIYQRTEDQWPSLVGIGSVCRRNLNGSDGLFAVFSAVDYAVPRHVKFHLFGVKGTAVRALRDHPRFHSMDSHAWALSARWEAYKADIPCDIGLKVRHLEGWVDKQTKDAQSLQPMFF